MIWTEKQYELTKEWANRFRQTIKEFSAPPGVDPRLVHAVKAGLLGQLADLEEEIFDYESRHDITR